MSAAPLLKVIDGGLVVTKAVPPLPPAREGERLYPVFKTGGGAFTHVVAVSLILHGALIAASLSWDLFGEERAAGGLEELIVIEGIDVLLLDQVPSMPAALAEAQEIETTGTAEPVTETEAASTVAPATGAVPLPGEAIPVGSDSAMEVAAEVAPESVTAAAAPGETIAAVEPEWTEAKAIEEVPQAAAPAMPIEVVDPEAAPASADEAASEPEKPLEPPPEDAATVEEKLAPAPPEETTAELVREETIKPVEETVTAAVSEVLPEPPAEEKRSEAPKPPAKKKSVASLPNPSTPSSEASPSARGPTKGKAGAGGKTPKAQGKASLSSYQSKLVAHLRRYRTYPDAARAKRLQGTVVVSFTINGSGRVVGASLAKGTGHSILDREALAMVRRASPFPAIPAGMGKSQVTVRAPIRFDMR